MTTAPQASPADLTLEEIVEARQMLEAQPEPEGVRYCPVVQGITDAAHIVHGTYPERCPFCGCKLERAE